jgi:uncharacterized protein (UPF0147 family)
MVDKKIKARLKELSEYMDEILKDNSVPRNVKKMISEAKQKVDEGKEDLIVRLSSAIYMLDEISSDINMQPYTRTEIWNLISALESIKEEVK